jgi:RNase P/RNase MRP subunit p29
VDYNQRRITVNTSVSESDAASLVGQTVRIANEHHASVYRIAGAGVSDETLTLDLTGSDVFTGRIKLGKVDPQAKTVATKTKVLYPFDLDGMTLVTEDLRHQARIRSMDNGVIRLTEDEDAKPFTTEGKDAWIADFGFGDSATIERSIHRHDP